MSDDQDRLVNSGDMEMPDEQRGTRQEEGPDEVVEKKPKRDPTAGMRWVHNGVPVISGPGSRLV